MTDRVHLRTALAPEARGAALRPHPRGGEGRLGRVHLTLTLPGPEDTVASEAVVSALRVRR